VYRVIATREVETYYRGPWAVRRSNRFSSRGRLRAPFWADAAAWCARSRQSDCFLLRTWHRRPGIHPSRANAGHHQHRALLAPMSEIAVSRHCRNAAARISYLAIGSELLTRKRSTRNRYYLTDPLNALGLKVVRNRGGDERERRWTRIWAGARSQIISATAELGPTETISLVTRWPHPWGRSPWFSFHPEICMAEARFKALPHDCRINRRQAYMIRWAAEILAERIRTAQAVDRAPISNPECCCPARPMTEGMFQKQCLPRLERITYCAVLRCALPRRGHAPNRISISCIAPCTLAILNP